MRRAAALLVFAALFQSGRSAAQEVAPERQTIVAEAQQSLLEGRPYRTTSSLIPILTGTGSQDPSIVLLAARAAAAWEGWGTVVRLLGNQTWLDSLEGGAGRALLARARVERSEPAVDDARRAVAGSTSETLAERLVVLARAYDRADQLDSAAAVYLRASLALPSIRDWLALRAGGVTGDSSARTALLQSLTRPAALPRIPWTDALARSRSGDHAGAARVYGSLNAPFPSARMRYQAATTDSERTLVRQEVVSLIERGLGADELRAAVALLDAGPGTLSTAEELTVARQMGAIDPARAVKGLARVTRVAGLKEADRLVYGTALARLGRHREALRVLATIRSGPLAGRATYQRSRSLLSLGQRPEAIVLLRRLLAGIPATDDSATRAQAGYVAADLLSEDGNEAAARTLYLAVARRFPRSPYAGRAAFQAALIAWVAGDRELAGRGFDSLATLPSEHSERAASLYWSGRVRSAQGDSSGAHQRWRTILERYPASYYAYRAAEKAGEASPIRAAGATPESAPDTLAAADFDRAALLERLGLRAEARLEYDWLARRGSQNPPARREMARAFQRRGMVGRAYRLAGLVADSGSQQLAYPLAEIPLLLEEAKLAQVDPLLAAAIIRQESGFELSARSRADARGWMQVMPSLGASMARGTGIREWDPSLLHHAEINLRFGMAHLSNMLKRLPRLPLVLAAYNAGSRAALRWANIAGAADDEVYIERIQYTETRDYVRRVLANLAAYRALYGRTPD